MSGNRNILSWLGIQHPNRFLDFKKIGILFGWFLLALALLYLAIILAMLSNLAVLAFGGTPLIAMEPRGFGIIFAGLVGFPFIVWRSVVAAKQSVTAQQSLSNEKFTAAANQLNARRQRSVLSQNQETDHTDVWEDDLNARNSAILILESLVTEDPTLAPRVDRLLAGYIRANFPCVEHAELDELEGIEAPRIDLQQAIEVIGKIHPIARSQDDTHWRLDLRRCNLVGVDFKNGDYFAADFSHSDVQFANLSHARFSGAKFIGCALSFSRFRGALLTGANFTGVVMTQGQIHSGNIFDGKNLQGMVITHAQLRGINRLRLGPNYADIVAEFPPQFNSEYYAKSGFSLNPLFYAATAEGIEFRSKRQIADGIEHWFVSSGPYYIEPRSVYQKYDMLHWPYWERD